MRYTIIKSPIINKYYIWDSEEKRVSFEKGFDIILEIVHDKIAIVGRATSYKSGYYFYSTYKYQLVDVKGRTISDKEFDYVYPYDTFIFCKEPYLPINKLSYLDNYIWENECGCYLSKNPFYSYDKKNAIVRGDYWVEHYKFGFLYQYIDTKGNVLKEVKVEKRKSVEETLFENRKIDYSNCVDIDVLGYIKDKKWERINELAKRIDMNYINICDFNLSEKYNFHNVRIMFAWEKFLILKEMKENPQCNRYDSRNKYKEGKCIAVLNDTFNIIYYSRDGFDIYPNTLHNRIIINHEYILCYDGRLYKMPENIKIDDFRRDCCGFIQIEKNEKIGFMNNEGKIVIPPIFPKDSEAGFDENEVNDWWRDYKKDIDGSVEDAFEGDDSARWNID